MNAFGPIKEFTWNSEKVGKSEYHEWYALLTRHLSIRGIALCLKADHTEIYRPIAPVQPPANAVAARQENYEILKANYDEAMRKFHEKFDTAIGIVRASLSYASKAANDFELALQVDGDPETKFRNGMARIFEKYCPQDPTDVNSIRRNMQEIIDTRCGGFHAYQSEFTRLRLPLVKVGAFPSMLIKRGLTNCMTNVCSNLEGATTRAIFGSETVTMKGSFYDLVDVDMAGNNVPMSSFKGNVLLVVNVASKCGLTDRNYSQLSKLADEYGPRGLKILAFPCNQFLGQEPGTNEQICSFSDKYQARNKLVWFDKGYVNGQGTRETYSYLKKELKADDGSSDISWNFAKFLVDHEGKPCKRYGPTTDPDSIKGDIEQLLVKKDAK